MPTTHSNPNLRCRPSVAPTRAATRSVAPKRAAQATLLLALSTVSVASPAHAQLTNASAAATAMGNTGTATARGYDAVYWNPAGLAMPGTKRWSVALLPTSIGAGAGPISFADLSNVGGQVVSDATKNAWLSRVSGDTPQKISALGEASLLAANIGRVGLQASVSGGGNGVLTRDALEVLLYGNAGRTGNAERYALNGSAVSGGALATVGVSYAHPIGIRFGSAKEQSAAFGVTVHSTTGLALVRAQDNGTVLESQPVEVKVNFPAVSPKSGSRGSAGSGFGLDVGAAWEGGQWRAGVALRNALNTFKWDESALAFRPISARYTQAARTSDFDERAYASAPTALRNWVTNATIPPTLAFGLAWTSSPRLQVSADAKQQFGEGMPWAVRRSIGTGVEYRPVGWLPLRGGVAALDRGAQFGGGFGLEGRNVRLQWSVVSRTDSQYGPQTVNSVTFAFGALGR